MKYIYVLTAFIMTMSFIGCSSAPKVTRTDIDETIDLSGHWNDSDSRMVADAMIEQVMDASWIDEFLKDHGRDPVVIVGTVINRSHEHVNVDTFVKDLEAALTNSGRVGFVADKQQRLELREERADMQTGNTEPATIKEKGHEVGADFMLQGTVNSAKDEIKGKYVNFFQVNLELVDLNTNEKRWIGQHKVKKLVERSRFSW